MLKKQPNPRKTCHLNISANARNQLIQYPGKIIFITDIYFAYNDHSIREEDHLSKKEQISFMRLMNKKPRNYE